MRPVDTNYIVLRCTLVHCVSTGTFVKFVVWDVAKDHVHVCGGDKPRIYQHSYEPLSKSLLFVL